MGPYSVPGVTHTEPMLQAYAAGRGLAFEYVAQLMDNGEVTAADLQTWCPWEARPLELEVQSIMDRILAASSSGPKPMAVEPDAEPDAKGGGLRPTESAPPAVEPPLAPPSASV